MIFPGCIETDYKYHWTVLLSITQYADTTNYILSITNKEGWRYGMDCWMHPVFLPYVLAESVFYSPECFAGLHSAIVLTMRDRSAHYRLTYYRILTWLADLRMLYYTFEIYLSNVFIYGPRITLLSKAYTAIPSITFSVTSGYFVTELYTPV